MKVEMVEKSPSAPNAPVEVDSVENSPGAETSSGEDEPGLSLGLDSAGSGNHRTAGNVETSADIVKVGC
jgi:hypothetical protein